MDNNALVQELDSVSRIADGPNTNQRLGKSGLDMASTGESCWKVWDTETCKRRGLLALARGRANRDGGCLGMDVGDRWDSQKVKQTGTSVGNARRLGLVGLSVEHFLGLLGSNVVDVVAAAWQYVLS